MGIVVENVFMYQFEVVNACNYQNDIVLLKGTT